jgi:hypothetical protein
MVGAFGGAVYIRSHHAVEHEEPETAPAQAEPVLETV